MTAKYKIYHNPRCSKSRAGLAYLQDAGVVPKIIRYLDTPPTEEELTGLLKKLGLGARALLRTREPAYKELNLADPALSEQALIAFMVAHPKLIERPIVVKSGENNEDKAVLARPTENISKLL